MPLGDLGSAASCRWRLVVHAVLAALLVWEGPGLLDLAFLGSSVLYVVMALDFGGSGQSSRETFLEWGMASVLASLVVGLQVARWRAWAWVERTLVSGDMEMYAERYSALATSPTLTFPFTHASTLSALAPSPPHTHIQAHAHTTTHMAHAHTYDVTFLACFIVPSFPCTHDSLQCLSRSVQVAKACDIRPRGGGTEAAAGEV